MPAFLSQRGVEGERKENSPVDCFPRESYTGFSHNSRRIKRAETFQLKRTSGTPKKAGAVRCLLFCPGGDLKVPKNITAKFKSKFCDRLL